ncbi:BAG domain-containing protein Samui [Araneus ventricosus]|uniref:BAG domain-containing protein Samui n=1 Tax=Araneus ventricosus TaxID=182803 RepID=A0A4Y2QH78_ARAVE|nr:BAG domain-containing protein Samui [Araneus ventricosus]GBN71472.1 BAG domain-containing protein Samui [Araneus ventricosus]
MTPGLPRHEENLNDPAATTINRVLWHPHYSPYYEQLMRRPFRQRHYPSSTGPSHYEDMSWSPSSRNFRSPGSSPETYRRIVRTEEDFPPTGRHKELDDEFFGGRKSPTFPRRIFKEVWNEAPSTNHRFGERPRMFKRVFKPNQWEEEFDKEDIPHLRRFEREFDRFDNNRPSSRKFDEDFDRRFSARDLQKDMKDEFEKSEGKVHHIPIMVERRMEEMKSRFGGRNSPPPERSHDDEYADDWSGPQVQRLKKTFEPEDDFPRGYHRVPRFDSSLKSRAFSNTIPDTWDPHAVHTLPTRKLHKASQSMDDSKHPVPPKSVFRSYSETHEDIPKPQQQHSAAFRSHSDGHCPNQTYVTKIEVNVPTPKEAGEQSSCSRSGSDLGEHSRDSQQNLTKQRSREEGSAEAGDQKNVKFKSKAKYDSPSLQQIAVVMQNVDDLIVRIEGYSGSGRDKHYRFLDEMLTRCMIRLDSVDTEGREDIRNARKAAIRDVQACIDRLEAKADESERQQQVAKSAPESGANTAVGDGPKRAIPLGDGSHVAIPLGDGSEKTDAPGDAPKHAIPLGEGPKMAIPLGDVPWPAIPLADRSTTPIPLGDVPRSTPKSDRQEDGRSDRKSYSRQNSGNGEQTKL